MRNNHHVFYVPGLGDPRYKSQGLLLKAWTVYGVTVHYYPMFWSDKRTFREKFEAFLAAIDMQVQDTGSA